MGWLNIFGLCIASVILIPNIVFAMKCKDGFENKWHNKYVEIAEQIGRFGCFAFMIFNVPGTCFGWPSNEAFAAYVIADGALAALYCLIWFVCFRKSSVFRALASVPVERNNEPVDPADDRRRHLRTQPYPAFI